MRTIFLTLLLICLVVPALSATPQDSCTFTIPNSCLNLSDTLSISDYGLVQIWTRTIGRYEIVLSSIRTVEVPYQSSIHIMGIYAGHGVRYETFKFVKIKDSCRECKLIIDAVKQKYPNRPVY